jgi:hypothetical protein
MLSFQTAYTIPQPIICEVAERFPRLKIEGTVFEDMGQFRGRIYCHEGEADYEDDTEKFVML